ncbi:hypothetical protein ACWGJW_20340 [Streptomyces nigrescens]
MPGAPAGGGGARRKGAGPGDEQAAVAEALSPALLDGMLGR